MASLDDASATQSETSPMQIIKVVLDEGNEERFFMMNATGMASAAALVAAAARDAMAVSELLLAFVHTPRPDCPDL